MRKEFYDTMHKNLQESFLRQRARSLRILGWIILAIVALIQAALWFVYDTIAYNGIAWALVGALICFERARKYDGHDSSITGILIIAPILAIGFIVARFLVIAAKEGYGNCYLCALRDSPIVAESILAAKNELGILTAIVLIGVIAIKINRDSHI